jgi:hypothetical protein
MALYCQTASKVCLKANQAPKPSPSDKAVNLQEFAQDCAQQVQFFAATGQISQTIAHNFGIK